MAVDIKSVLKQKSALIDSEIKNYLPATSSIIRLELKELNDLMWEYTLRGGKRIRPGLCLLSAVAYGGDEKTAMPAAISLELFHNFVLVHDDFEDGSDERRGKPCLHKMVGPELAINVGDGVYAKVFEAILLKKEELGSEKALKLIKEMLDLTYRTMQGQHVEISWMVKNKFDQKFDDYYFMAEHKTSWYTACYPIRMGAICAGASDEEIEKITEWGVPFGLAFQIQDDWLNLAGDEAKYGKEIGGDILEGKRTLMLIHLLNGLEASEKSRVIGVMKKPRAQKTQADVDYILGLMREKGSLDYAKEKSKELAEKAKEIFERNSSAMREGPEKDAIRSLIDYVINREA
ncbi:polyprenyl synthetase family protein [Candidatus Micrarchaeota archaeon]|nr:polyprenyl synthetase family protein [Candidatus Micrarchaeota archaeon]